MNFVFLLQLMTLMAVLALSCGCWLLARWLIEEVFTRANPDDYLFQALLTLPMIGLLTMVSELIARAVSDPHDDKGGND